MAGHVSRSEIREQLQRAGAKHRHGERLKAMGTAEIERVIIAAESALGVTEIARLCGLSRRAVYDILARIERDLD
ncbi:MAG: hypothetical protein WDZ37_03630 [Solirubrobacterales bacterium]